MRKKIDTTVDHANKLSILIEETLAAFGIKGRICEVNDEDDAYRCCLEIVMGTRVDDILALDKDLSLALATIKPVKIIAPVSGRSIIEIIVPKTTKTPGE